MAANWHGIGTLNGDGKYTTHVPIPDLPLLQGLDLQFQGVSRDAAGSWYLVESSAL